MAFEHIRFPVFGVHHPESILSEYGIDKLNYFLSKVGDY